MNSPEIPHRKAARHSKQASERLAVGVTNRGGGRKCWGRYGDRTALSSRRFFRKIAEIVNWFPSCRTGVVAVSPGHGSIVGTGGTSGSKPKGRTRSRVELFTFPEQLPGPARFGEGDSVDPTLKLAARYVEDPWIAARRCAEIWKEFRASYSWWHTQSGREFWLRDDADGDMGTELGVQLILFCRVVRLARRKRPEVFDALDVELLTNWAWKLWRTTKLLQIACGNMFNSDIKFGDLAESTVMVQKNFQDFIDLVAWTQSEGDNPQVPEELLIVSDAHTYAALVLDDFGFGDPGSAFGSDEKRDGLLKSTGRDTVTSIPLTAIEDEEVKPEERQTRPSGDWCEDDREVIAESLSGQQLKLFHVLWRRDRWTHYGMLKNVRAEMIWRGQPDPGDISDSTVFEALRKLQKAMPPESPYVLKIENESQRVKIER